MARRLFVTGTDTGVGKTVVACALVRGLRELGARVAVMKPVASGATRTPEGLRSADALALIQAAGATAPYPRVNPYCFEPAISPHIAAKEAMIDVDIGTIRGSFDILARDSDWVVVEGAGGWLAPINESQSMADLALVLEAPALMVVGVRLGCLNHAQLTRSSIEARGVPFAGWIASEVDPAMMRADENLASLERLLGEPALAVVRHAPAALGSLTLAQAAAQLAQQKATSF
ncbi:MAG: dethiobiotin synthase [Gammaproteobacteria bacterium]|nr:MAG: dethiobiotin synthase [Gammaproteobacteria bacterium]